jgi:hypothetical protein
MKKLGPEWQCTVNDLIVKRWWNTDVSRYVSGQRLLSQGKRVSADFPMERRWRREYVRGVIPCVKALREHYHCTLPAAYGYLKVCRSGFKESLNRREYEQLRGSRIPTSKEFLSKIKIEVR